MDVKLYPHRYIIVCDREKKVSHLFDCPRVTFFAAGWSHIIRAYICTTESATREAKLGFFGSSLECSITRSALVQSHEKESRKKKYVEGKKSNTTGRRSGMTAKNRLF